MHIYSFERDVVTALDAPWYPATLFRLMVYLDRYVLPHSDFSTSSVEAFDSLSPQTKGILRMIITNRPGPIVRIVTGLPSLSLSWSVGE